MRKLICVSLLTLSFLVSMASAAPAYARSVNGVMTQIPFDFYVGDRLAPAGKYTVTSLNDDESALRICNGRQGNTVLTNSASEMGQGRSRLVFHKYGDQYFLRAVWGADNMGRRLRETKRERSLRKEILTARGHASEIEVVTIDAR
jgi:hypothetical protein